MVRLFLLLLACLPTIVHGQEILREEGQEAENEAVPLLVPYGFYTDILGLGLGVGAGLSGYPNEVSSLGGTLALTTNDSGFAAFVASDLPVGRRLFVDVRAFVGHFPDVRIYENGNLDFPEERAGSHESSPDNFREGRGNDAFAEVDLAWVTPLGWRRREPVPEIVLADGFPTPESLETPTWQPWRSGATQLRLAFFYRYMNLDLEPESGDIVTNSLRLSVERDNRDFGRNPERGSRQELLYARDFGWLDSRESWSYWEAELSKYFRLGSPGRWLRQAVLAVDLWTAESPSWELSGPEGTIRHRPPFFEGASLGGYQRMRALTSGRYNDKAAIYSSAELRLMPRWNPLEGKELLDTFRLEWFQVVPFVEVGRVAPEWDASLLHEDPVWDVGLDLRLWVSRTLVRIGVAVGEEDWAIKAGVDHTF